MSLSQRAVLVFRPEELNELIFWAYNIIDRAIRQQSDSIIVGLDKISWCQENTELGTFPIRDAKIASMLSSTFDLLIQKDIEVKARLKVISKKEEITVYQLKNDESVS